MAIKELLSNHERYDLHLPDDGWSVAVYDTLSIEVEEEKLDFRKIAAAMDMGYRELKELNPQYRRSWLPRGRHRLVLPRDGVDSVLAIFPSARVLAAAPTPGGENAATEDRSSAVETQSSAQTTSARN